MKIAPVSGDLLVKIGIAAGVLALVYFGVKKAADAVGGLGVVQWGRDLATTADQVGRGIATNFSQPLDERTVPWAENTPAVQAATGNVYANPLMTNQGAFFGYY